MIINKVLIATHHKTGIAWMRQIFSKICELYGLRFLVGSMEDINKDFDFLLQNHSKFDFSKISFDYKGIHLIRDPRDRIISGCFYHQGKS